MSQENLDLIHEMHEAFLRRDAETANQLLADDIEWDTTRIAETVPDLAGVYRGAEQSRDLWRAWLSPWRKLEMEYELRDSGDDVVSLIREQRQWGRYSGVVTDIQPYAWVYTLREGKVVRGCWYPDHRSGLAAIGLAE